MKLLRVGDVVETVPRPSSTVRGERRQRWYAVFTGSRCEHRVQRDLERFGYPTMVLLYMLDGARPRNLMPRYVFARFDAQGDPWAEIEDMDGVVGVVRNADVLIPVPPRELAELAMECLAGLYDRREYKRPAPLGPIQELAAIGKTNKFKHKSSKKPGKWVAKRRARDKRRARRLARSLMARLAKARNS